ncbi:hypothetical protein JKF63_05211 [Porcisia hertigi]|uniref:Uncharacterized protein n=1 Tax=Porcisia hertigi TaxID=2761500 RepID=A0A836IT99_9TRYP|nr:hypothetical protein JKF63_05211 [Porcisia hertigi]
MRVARAFSLGGCCAGSLANTSSAVRCEARCLHRRHSPDRSYSQEIQDRQNSFRWSAHHVFRPHQHFTYDPTSWSRPLEEKVKKARPLSLVERMKMAADHAAESIGNGIALDEITQDCATAAQGPAGCASEEAVPDYFFATTDSQGPPPSAVVSGNSSTPSSRASGVSLQELAEEVQRLQRLLHSPRFSGNASLQRRARQEADYQVTLLHLYERLRDARLDETVTPDACAFGWFLLMRGLEPLLLTVTRARQEGKASDESSGGSEDAAAIRDVFTALHRAVLVPMKEGGLFFDMATSGKLSLEALVELLSIATTPFVRRCVEGFAEGDNLSSEALLRYVECISALARQREHGVAGDVEAVEETAAQEWLDPMHLAAWATSLRRLWTREAPLLSAVVVVELHIHHAAEYITQLLQTVTGVTPGGHVAASLCRQHRRSQQATASPKRSGALKPICLDGTSAPHGVQAPPTESDDTENILVAATAALRLTQRAASSGMVREEGAQRIVSVCLRMLTHTPNYDLCADEVVAWACEVLDAGHLMHIDGSQGTVCGGSGSTDVSRSEALRFLLLLSRLSYGSVVNRVALGHMVLCLCRWPEPAHTSDRERSEWRRLRGVVMGGALRVLQVSDLAAAAEHLSSPGTLTWLEALAFGEYGGVIPIALWRDAAVSLFPRLRYYSEGAATAFSTLQPRGGASISRCRPEEAHALCILCSRYLAQGKTSVSVPTNLHSIFTARCVAECLAVMLGSPTLPEELLCSADRWDGLCTSLPESVQMVAIHMQEVVRREVSSPKVISF